jgi:hypothetical protein
MTEPKNTAGMIQKYCAEKAIPWASRLIQSVSGETFAAAAVLAVAIAIAPMKRD